MICPFCGTTVIPGTKSKKPSPLFCGSLLKLSRSKLKKRIKGVSLIGSSLPKGVGKGVPSTGKI